MIPKVIHYCWFGPNKMPKMVEMCIASWKEHLVDYEFMFWNESNSPMEISFVRDVYEKKNMPLLVIMLGFGQFRNMVVFIWILICIY